MTGKASVAEVDPTRHRYRPSQLDGAPEVNALLAELGLGRLVAEDLESYGGRNANWAGVTSAGHDIFVKQFADEDGEGERNLRRAIEFERLVAGVGTAELRTPRCLGWSERTRLMVFERLANARTGAELAQDKKFSPALSHRAGAMLGALHRMPADEAMDTAIAPMPPLSLLEAIPLEAVADLSMAQMQAWSLMQEDADFVAAVSKLRAEELDAPKTPTHTDIRLDQFILATDVLHLIDWEEFRLADPARDVGAYLGEWLFRATFLILETSDEQSTELRLRHEDIVDRGVAAFRSHRPLLGAFWSGYLDQASPDPELPRRAAGYAGWHLFERLLGIGRERSTLSPFAKAAAGVGRTILLDPEAAVPLLGMNTATAPRSAHQAVAG